MLDELVNLKSERDRRLFKAYLATLPLEYVGRPIFNASGAMGWGKTTIGRVVKRVWAPTAPETVRFDPRDFLQKAMHAFIVMVDNQNTIPEWAADSLWRLVTGEADSKRRLYTDDEDFIIELRRAVILNGINVRSLSASRMETERQRNRCGSFSQENIPVYSGLFSAYYRRR